VNGGDSAKRRRTEKLLGDLYGKKEGASICGERKLSLKLYEKKGRKGLSPDKKKRKEKRYLMLHE